MTNYKFTIEVSVREHSDERAYEKLLELTKPLYGMSVETVSCEVNGKLMSDRRFEDVKNSVFERN